MENRRIVFEVLNTDTFYIGGEGKVTHSDIKTLLNANDVLVTDIVNIIFGDEITEIDYNVINDYRYLESIKLGKSIKRIRNGSIKNNPNLKYIFIDSSLEAVGRDFLDNSKEKLTIITDGNISHIQSLIGTEGEKIKIISRIDSYLDLRNTNHEVANAVGFWW